MNITESLLAIDGGAPVRNQPMPPRFVGANLIGDEEKQMLEAVIDDKSLYRHYGPGRPHFVRDLEQEFSSYMGTKFALATATGSGACFCAMRALGIGPDDEVIIPAFGWITDYAMVDAFGAAPVFAAIDASMNISPEDFEAKITPRTKAVVVVYYQGGAARIDEIVAIARKHDIKVLEDNAQACGCDFKGRKVGAWGDIGCISLQGNKVITTGEGGLLVTNDQRYYEIAVRYHDLGLLRDTFKANLPGDPLTEPITGRQWRMNELTAAVGLAQLRKLPGVVTACQAKSATLRRALTTTFPSLVFRATAPEHDIGILLAFDLKTAENARFFRQAYEAEGLVHGPASWCEVLCDIPEVSSQIPRNGIHDDDTFETTRSIDARMAKLAVLPVYSDQDIDDMAAGATKVLAVMFKRNML